MVRGAVAAGVEREQAEALAEAVVDEPEVVASEEPAAELEDDRSILGPRQLVVDPGPVLDLRVGHCLLLLDNRRARLKSGTRSHTLARHAAGGVMRIKS